MTEGWPTELAGAHFQGAVTREGRAGCLICQIYGDRHGLRERCTGPREGHHLIAKRKLRGALSPIPSSLTMVEEAPYAVTLWYPQDLAIADARNGIPVRRSHHEALEDGRIELHPEDILRAGENELLTTNLIDFAMDWGVEHWLPAGLG